MKVHVESLIERIVQAYASARLYTDRGTVALDLATISLRAEFETSFERPDRFLFSVSVTALEDGGSKYRYAHRLLAEGTDLRLGDPEWRTGRPESLASAVACLTGVSYGSAHIIPRLLMPGKIDGRALFDWPERTLDEPAMIDGAPHFVIKLRKNEEEERVYVSEATLVVRRIEWNGPVPRSPDRFTTTDYFAVLSPNTVS